MNKVFVVYETNGAMIDEILFGYMDEKDAQQLVSSNKKRFPNSQFGYKKVDVYLPEHQKNPSLCRSRLEMEQHEDWKIFQYIWSILWNKLDHSNAIRYNLATWYTDCLYNNIKKYFETKKGIIL